MVGEVRPPYNTARVYEKWRPRSRSGHLFDRYAIVAVGNVPRGMSAGPNI